MSLLGPALNSAADRGLNCDIETQHLDPGYGNRVTRMLCQILGIDDLACTRKHPHRTASPPMTKQSYFARPAALGSGVRSTARLERHTPHEPAVGIQAGS